MASCLFCEIVAGRSPATVEYQDEEILAFRDVYPKAPVHVLVVPRRHIESVMTLEEQDAGLIGRLVLAARRIAEAKGLAQGYRLAVNCGPEGGQVVYHLHLHLLGGRRSEARLERR